MKYSILDLKNNFNKEENTLDINLSGDEMGILIGKRGQTLDSLQYLTSLVVNKEKDDMVRDFLISLPDVGTTVIDAEGGYSSEDETLLLAVVPTRSYFIVKEGLKEIDNNIFFLVCDSYEVSDNGDLS